MRTAEQRPALDVGQFSTDPGKSYTLPSRFYTDPDVYATEKAAIFQKSWIFAGAANSLAEPGAFTTVQIAGQNIAVVRGRDGKLRGFHNVCSHRAHELLTGSGRTKLIVCPYHAWTYELDGALRANKVFGKVDGFDTREFCLKTVKIEEFLGFVFFNMDPQARPLAEQAADVAQEVLKYCPQPEQLKFAARLTFEVKANWKNIADNFQECYHCPLAHPQFVQLVDNQAYRSHQLGIATGHLAPGRADSAAYKFDPTAPGAQPFYAGWFLWPNVALNVFPGRRNLSFLHIIPTGPETSLEHWDFFLEDETPNEEEQASIDYVERVLQPEDIGIVESVQRGLHSKAYEQGRFVVTRERDQFSEHGVHYFQAMWRKAMDGHG